MDDLLTSIADLIDRARNPAVLPGPENWQRSADYWSQPNRQEKPGAKDRTISRHGPGGYGLQPARQ